VPNALKRIRDFIEEHKLNEHYPNPV
jgi:hypothetical protein